MVQHNNSTAELTYQTLRSRAYQLLPKVHTYDGHGNIVIPGGFLPDEDGHYVRFYEEFMREVHLCDEFEDNRGMRSLALELDRLESGIDLVGDVSEFPDPEWLVEGFIVRNGLTMLYGDAGTGKTTLCLYVADSVQKSKDLFGLKCKYGKVLFVSNDEAGELLKSHRDMVGLPERLDVAKYDVLWNGKGFNPEFEDMLRYYDHDIVVVDTYTSLGITDITRPESGLVLDETKRLGKKYRKAMLVTHHVNLKGEQMGSSLHRGKTESMISLRQLSEDRIVLTQDKIRGSKFPPKIINFNQDTLEMRDAKVSMKQQVQELKAAGFSDREIVDKFHKSNRESVRRYLREKPTPEEVEENIGKPRKDR